MSIIMLVLFARRTVAHGGRYISNEARLYILDVFVMIILCFRRGG